MEIHFRPYLDHTGDTENTPRPSIKSLPSWFSAIPRFSENKKKFTFSSSGSTIATVKWCNPFMDSLTAGYVMVTEYDLQVKKDGENSVFSWKAGGEDLVSNHLKNQVSTEMIPKGFSEQPYKFRNDWSIKTPRGYSALFMHPLNRGDLPFYTLSGFVDTDDYNMPVNFPFLIQKDFEGIIPAGTPIAQLIPIKREAWSHKINKFDPLFNRRASSKFNATIYRAYKTLFWKRKQYK